VPLMFSVFSLPTLPSEKALGSVNLSIGRLGLETSHASVKVATSSPCTLIIASLPDLLSAWSSSSQGEAKWSVAKMEPAVSKAASTRVTNVRPSSAEMATSVIVSGWFVSLRVALNLRIRLQPCGWRLQRGLDVTGG
jgi:hypothetical protein